MSELAPVPQARDNSVSIPADLAAEIDGWYRGKILGYDWTSAHFPGWIGALGLRDVPRRILEVGSYEGRSAIFFLNYFPRSTLTCVDWWNPATLWPELAERYPEPTGQAEGRFDHNVAAFGERITKIKENSADALAEQGVQRKHFDLIYVDGDHRRLSAYRDCLLAWALLERGGILIMDDYEFDAGLGDDKRPKQGIDAFLRAIDGDYAELHRAYQIIIRRIRWGMIP